MTTPLEEFTVVGMHNRSRARAWRICYGQVRILAAMLLLGAVWWVLFLWGLEVTKQWLISWTPAPSAQGDSWQQPLVTLLHSDNGSYLAAFAPVLISLALFFYRVPRGRRRLSVAVEFVLTTGLFVAFNLLTMQFIQRIALVVAQLSFTPASGLEIDAEQLIGELSFAVTLVMLAGLFWLQGSGYLRATWRHWRRYERAVRIP